jgi:hypothetical protein
VIRPLTDRGTRWRFAWLFQTFGGTAAYGFPHVELGMGTYLGVGVPVDSHERVRVEHGFGYFGEIAVSDGRWGVLQRHGVAAAGRVGDRTGVFYQAGLGGTTYGLVRVDGVGPSAAVKVGCAMGHELDVILSVGATVDVLFDRDGYAAAVPVLSLSLMTFGQV